MKIIISSIYSKVLTECNMLGCTAILNEEMKMHTSFKIGGPADVFVYVNNTKSLATLLNLIKKNDLPFFILGNGTNLLIADEGYRGIVLSLTKSHETLNLENESTIVCSAGIPLAKACVFALHNSLSGLEFAWGIPGSCGGAAFMNAGAYGHDMSEIVLETTHITPYGKTETLRKNELDFSYRRSFYTSNPFPITSVKLGLIKSDSKIIRSKMYENISKRKSKQPLEYSNAGSVFKRPEGYYAGALIQKCGLMGKTVGGASVSLKHAGFIINNGNASASDVANLISIIKNEVSKKFNVTLQCEIKTLGNIKL